MQIALFLLVCLCWQLCLNLKFTLTEYECFYEDVMEKQKITFYYKMLSGASPKIGVEIKSENGNTLYKKETDQDTVTMTAPSKDTYRMCFYPVFDMIALDNIVFFDIDPGNPRHYESDIFQNVSSLEKHIMETLTETEMLLNHFNMKLEMNHGDLTNDILVVSNLKNKVFQWSLFHAILIIISTIVQLILVKRLFVNS
uniref:Transmembrane emp24 domain-containing protein 7 (Trinotate prediction) n=1 Tax=Henneguya salminicola TaxID=69463 RepID=A0A6G3MJE5_HENSL